MQEIMVYTPEAHIPIAGVTVDHGVYYLEFKKNRSNAYETITLDQLIYLIVQAVERYNYGRTDERYYRN